MKNSSKDLLDYHLTNLSGVVTRLHLYRFEQNLKKYGSRSLSKENYTIVKRAIDAKRKVWDEALLKSLAK
jgi:hypothetical protein